MGQIVAAMATMRAPQLFTRPPEEVAMRAYPVGALMAIHVLQSEQRRMLRGAA